MTPTIDVAWRVALLAMTLGSVFAAAVAVLRRRGVRVAYTRKMFHFAVFSMAAAVHSIWSLPGTVVFGSVIAGMVLSAVASFRS